MGRTNPTYRDQIRRTKESWSDFRRGLRQRDHDAYDSLWEHASTYADAAGYHNPSRTFDGVFMSIALAQERRIAELEEELAALRDDDTDV